MQLPAALSVTVPLETVQAPLAVNATGRWNGETFYRAQGGDVVLNDGIDCFFSNNARAAKALEELVGHEIGQANAGQDAYRLRVRLDNGIYQTVTQASIGNLRVGDSVRVENGRAYRY